MEEYLAIHGLLLDRAMEDEDRSGLTDCLEELVCDLQRTPADLSGKMEDLRAARDLAMIAGFQKRARMVYEDYPHRVPEGNVAFQGRGVVYTVITGGYDVLREPEYVDKELDYICFTDNRELHSDIWKIRVIENAENLDNTRLARKHKILCHRFLPEYDYSVYVDGKIQIMGNLKAYIEKYSKGSAMLCFPHHVRQCAYEEAQICIVLGLDDEELIKKQMEGYRQEVRSKSRRDQLSLGYVCWKNDFYYDICDLFIYQNEYICKKRERENAW